MNEFRYRALDRSGHPQLGRVKAGSWEEALEILAEEGYQHVEQGGDHDERWARWQELRYLVRHLDTGKLLILLGIILGLAIFGWGLRWASHKTLKVSGIYSAPGQTNAPGPRVAGKKRAPASPVPRQRRRRLELTFFVDGREVQIQPKTLKVTRSSYEATLSFYQWSTPSYLMVQLRMKGYRPAFNRPVPLRNHKADQVLNLPALTLSPVNPPGKKGPLPPRRTNPKEWMPQ